MSYNARREAFRNSKRKRAGLPMGAIVTLGGGGSNRSRYSGGGMATRSRVPSYLRVKGTKAFQMTCAPVALAFGQGTAATQGVNWYGLNTVPAAPVYVNNPTWQIGFTLAGAILNINGSPSGTGATSTPITNYTEYTSLFDSYRIRKVELTMVYNSNSSTLGPGTSLPVVSMCNDYDDIAATTLSSMQQYDSYRLIQFGNNSNNGKVMHRVSPRISTVVETTGGSAIAGTGSNKNWIDCNNTSVLYCGVKGNYDNMNISTAAVGFITFYIKYYVEFKNSR